MKYKYYKFITVILSCFENGKSLFNLGRVTEGISIFKGE
jgi:hypothetical protein